MNNRSKFSIFAKLQSLNNVNHVYYLQARMKELTISIHQLLQLQLLFFSSEIKEVNVR